MGRRRVLGLSAEVAFWLFLSLLPLAAVGGMIAAKIAVGHRVGLSSWLSGIPFSMREFIANELVHVAAWRDGAVGPLGAMIFVWLGSSGVHALFDAFEAMTNGSRSWLSKRIAALVSCVVLSVAGAILALLANGIEWARALVDVRSIPLSGPVGVALRAVGGGFLFFGIVAGLYAIGLPARERDGLPIVPGAVFATLLQAALAFAYGWVIRTTGDGSAYLAGLATIGVTMTFVYLYVLSILVGLSVNQWWGVARARSQR